jgi:trigger factor
LKLPGFRAGHVPPEVARNQISQSEIINNALNKAIDANYKLLMEDKSFQSQNLIEDAVTIDLQKVDVNVLEIIYVFEKYPDVKLPDYKNIKIDYHEPKVDDAEVDREISGFTKRDNMLVPKDNGLIAKGDMVNFNFKGFLDDKPFPGGEAQDFELEIGSNSFIPGFEDKMIGLKKGEEKSIEVTFPKDYHVADLANKKTKFELKINDIKTIQKPKLDEEYIARFKIPEVKTEAEFKKYLHKQIHEQKKYTSRQGAIKKISEYLIEHSELSYMPKSLINAEIKRLEEDTIKRAEQVKVSKDDFITQKLGYKSNDDFNKALNDSAQKNLKLVVTLEKIISELKLEVSQSELDEHLNKMAKVYGMTIDAIKERFQNNFEGIKTFILQEKVFDKLIDLNK